MEEAASVEVEEATLVDVEEAASADVEEAASIEVEETAPVGMEEAFSVEIEEAASVDVAGEYDTKVSLGFFCSLGISMVAKALSKESLLESSEDICSLNGMAIFCVNCKASDRTELPNLKYLFIYSL